MARDAASVMPGGREVQMSGISLYRIADGRLQEAWVKRDNLFGGATNRIAPPATTPRLLPTAQSRTIRR
jgi:hypothetical protein